jgi:hypothetical protein
MEQHSISPPLAATLTFAQALERAELCARQTLGKDYESRISCAVAIVTQGALVDNDDGTWTVASQSEPGTDYLVRGTSCPCEDATYRALQGRCKHVLAILLLRKTQHLLEEAHHLPVVPEADAPAPAPPDAVPLAVPEIDPRYVTTLHGKPFIQYAGLLQMAREQGLQSLEATWTYHDDGLALAQAVAVFADGRRFVECGDSTPASGQRVGDAWRRLALTRAKARALRDALTLGICAEEELD